MAKALMALEAGSTKGAAQLPSPHVASCLKTVADWAGEITRFLERGKSSTLDLARTVYQAKTSLSYGQWSELFTSRGLPFGKRKAEMLVVVGREFGQLDAQTFAHLPAGWSILYQLAQLRSSDFEALIADGTIHPALTLAQAKGLVARFKGRAKGHARRLGVKRRLRHFSDFLRQTSGDWTAKERDLVRAQLFHLALELKDLHVPLLSVNGLFPDRTSLANGSPNN